MSQFPVKNVIFLYHKKLHFQDLRVFWRSAFESICVSLRKKDIISCFSHKSQLQLGLWKSWNQAHTIFLVWLWNKLQVKATFEQIYGMLICKEQPKLRLCSFLTHFVFPKGLLWQFPGPSYLLWSKWDLPSLVMSNTAGLPSMPRMCTLGGS